MFIATKNGAIYGRLFYKISKRMFERAWSYVKISDKLN